MFACGFSTQSLRHIRSTLQSAMLALLVTAVAKVLAYGLLLVVILWCWFQWHKWDFLQAARKLPCTVKGFPILGHAPYLLFRSWEEITNLALEAFSMAAVSQGLYNVCAWCGPLPIVLIHKPEDIQKILTSPCTAEKGYEIEFLKYAVGNGLLSAPVHIWKVTRRHISPLFHSLHIEQLMPMFNTNSRELVAELAEHVEGEPVDMLHPAMSVALKTTCQLIFGTELSFDIKSKAFKNMLKVVHDVPALYMKRIIKPWLRVDFIFELFYRKELKEINDRLKAFTESPLKIAKIIHAKKINSSSRLKEFERLSNEGTSKPNLVDVYTELQQTYPEFSENDLISEIKTLFGAGTDTVGLTVSSCLLVLGKYQDIQDRVYNEINTVVGPDDDVTVDHIGRLQYLDQVYKETLRWSVTVPYILRRTTEELKLSDCTIPPGNSVAVCLVGPLMDPTIYPNPQRFDPEHFSPEKRATRNKNAFIPFGSGSRMCIGKKYADYLVKTMLVHLLRRYRVSTETDIYNIKKVLAVTLVCSEGYHVRLQTRKENSII